MDATQVATAVVGAVTAAVSGAGLWSWLSTRSRSGTAEAKARLDAGVERARIEAAERQALYGRLDKVAEAVARAAETNVALAGEVRASREHERAVMAELARVRPMLCPRANGQWPDDAEPELDAAGGER